MLFDKSILLFYRYEEDNFVRLQMSKAQKQAAKRVSAKSTLQSLLDFGDYNAEDASEPKKRKRPVSKVCGNILVVWDRHKLDCFAGAL